MDAQRSALVGVYGVLHYAVRRRTHEFGVRMALGANKADVTKLVLTQAVRIVVPGMILGIAGSLALTRLLRSELFEVSPTDPVVLGGVAAALAGITLAASYLLAHRATRVQPVQALRHQ